MMQILLAKEINGNKLPESTLLLAAGNPAITSDDEGVDYGVNEMNHALKDRLTMLEIVADIDTWTEWAQNEITYEDGSKETTIDMDVIEFLASNPEMLHVVNDVSEVLPTPRSWEKVSNIKRFFEVNKGVYTENTLASAISGTVGSSATHAFMNFMENKDNPLIQPEEILSGEEFSEDFKTRIKSESIPRLTVASRLLARYYAKLTRAEKTKKQNLVNYTEFLELVPRDTVLGILQTLANDFEKEVFDVLITHSDFVSIYYDINDRVR